MKPDSAKIIFRLGIFWNVPDRDGDEEDGPAPIPDPDPVPDPNPDPFPGPGPKPRPQRTSVPVTLENERNLVPDANDLRKRVLMFTSPVQGEIEIAVDASGLSSSERLTIIGTSAGTTEHGRVVLTTTALVRVAVNVEFDAPYGGPIEISAIQVGDPEQRAA